MVAGAISRFIDKAKAIGFKNAVSRGLARTINVGSRTAGLPSSADGSAINEIYGPWTGVIPLPNFRLLDSTGAPTVENFLVVGDAWSQVVASYIEGPTVVLDMGCGCGKTARFLVKHPWISNYIGFDTIMPSIMWNRNYITSYRDTFVFHHVDVHSNAYNPDGKIKCKDVIFPAESASVNLAFAASLFTHLFEEDSAHYLEETARCLAPKGKALLSIHASNSKSDTYSGDEFRADIEHDHFVNMASTAGLTFINRLDNVAGQQVYVFEK